MGCPETTSVSSGITLGYWESLIVWVVFSCCLMGLHRFLFGRMSLWEFFVCYLDFDIIFAKYNKSIR